MDHESRLARRDGRSLKNGWPAVMQRAGTTMALITAAGLLASPMGLALACAVTVCLFVLVGAALFGRSSIPLRRLIQLIGALRADHPAGACRDAEMSKAATGVDRRKRGRSG